MRLGAAVGSRSRARGSEQKARLSLGRAKQKGPPRQGCVRPFLAIFALLRVARSADSRPGSLSGQASSERPDFSKVACRPRTCPVPIPDWFIDRRHCLLFGPARFPSNAEEKETRNRAEGIPVLSYPVPSAFGHLSDTINLPSFFLSLFLYASLPPSRLPKRIISPRDGARNWDSFLLPVDYRGVNELVDELEPCGASEPRNCILIHRCPVGWNYAFY